MLAGYPVPRSARALNNFLAKEPIALHGVLIAFRTSDLVLTKTDHADSRAQGFSVLNRSAEVCGFECEHQLFLLTFITATGEEDLNELCRYPKDSVPSGIEKTCLELYQECLRSPQAFLIAENGE